MSGSNYAGKILSTYSNSVDGFHTITTDCRENIVTEIRLSRTND